MALRTLKATGGNWNSTGTWNEGVVPVAGDTVTCSGGGNLTVTATAACASLDFTGFSNTFTINNLQTLTLTSTFTMVSGMSVAGTGSITLNGTLTVTFGGKTPSWNFTLQGANTYTLADNARCVNLTVGSGSNAITVNGNQWTSSGVFTLGTGGIASGTTKYVLTGTSWTGTGTLQNNIDINTAGTMSIGSSVKYNTGTLHIVAGSINTTTVLSFTGSMSLNMDGFNPSGSLFNVTITVAATITNLSATGYSTLTLPNANVTFAGAFDIGCGKLTNASSNGRTYTFVSGQILNVGVFNIQSSLQSTHNSIVASTPGSQIKLKIDPGTYSPSSQNAIYVDLTDVDATLGNACVVYGGTQSNCLNCFTTAPIPACRQPTQRAVIGR